MFGITDNVSLRLVVPDCLISLWAALKEKPKVKLTELQRYNGEIVYYSESVWVWQNTGFVYAVRHKIWLFFKPCSESIFVQTASDVILDRTPLWNVSCHNKGPERVTACPHRPHTPLSTQVYNWSSHHTEVSHFCHINWWWTQPRRNASVSVICCPFIWIHVTVALKHSTTMKHTHTLIHRLTRCLANIFHITLPMRSHSPLWHKIYCVCALCKTSIMLL